MQICSWLQLIAVCYMSACWQLAFCFQGSFRVGKDILIDKFWLCVGLFGRLGNVYGLSMGFHITFLSFYFQAFSILPPVLLFLLHLQYQSFCVGIFHTLILLILLLISPKSFQHVLSPPCR